MICPNCQTVNDAENVFCVNCGMNFANSQNIHASSPNLPNVPPPDTEQFQNFGNSDSIETSVLPNYQYQQQSMPNYNPAMPNSGVYPSPPKKRNWLLIVGLPLILLALVGGGLAFLLYKLNSSNAETLPEHFGFFVQNEDKSKLSEIKKTDAANALESKKTLLENNNLPEVKSNAHWIYYNNEVSLDDVKLIQLDTIKDDGSFMQLDFQAAPIEGKSGMKKVRTEKELAKGKYAFAIFDGNFDEGKHKFWAFEVKSSGKSNNDELAKSSSIPLKPKPEKPKVVTVQEVPAPPGAEVRYVGQASVVMRSGPSQTASAVGKFQRGQKVYVLGYSDNFEVFSGKSGTYNSNYAQVQTSTGKKGWIYAAFLK